MMPSKFIPRENPELYEINTAAWLFELSEKAGKTLLLGDVPAEEWDRFKAWGMDFIWLMGVWNRSQEGRKISLNSPESQAFFKTVLPTCTPEDIIGSCYSISAYGPDPLIGTWEDLDRARDELHRRGMGLILDFVPNHTGIDHHWLFQHPDYYIQVSEEVYRKDPDNYFPITSNGKVHYIAHGRDPNFPAWTDTAQLNYFNPAVRSAMIERIADIARHCDGIRCDMAMLELSEIFQRVWGWTNKDPGYIMPAQEFWFEATRQVPDLVYIAEAYWDTEWTLQQLGFDYVYDKRLYDRLRGGSPHEVYLHLTAGMDYQKKLARFIENHDELRSVAAFGKSKVKPAAAIISTLPGMRLFFAGQMEGKRIRLPIQIRQSRPEAVDPEIQAFYNKLLPLVSEKIFHAGEWRLRELLPEVDRTSENLVAYTWKLDQVLRLVTANLDQHPSQARIRFQDELLNSKDYLITDLLSGFSFRQKGAEMLSPGMALQLAGYQARIFDISPAG
jgi:hypothetical protein